MITGKLITRASSSSLATRTTSEFFAISAQLLSLSVDLTPVIEKGRDPLDSVRVSDKSSSDGNPPSVPRETEKRKKNSGHRGGGGELSVVISLRTRFGLHTGVFWEVREGVLYR